MRAFRHSVGLKAGTPFETASTPVIALQPSAKARISRSRPSDSTGTTAGVTPVTCGGRAEQRLADAHRDEAERDDEEDVGRGGERGAALAEAAQVDEHDEQDRDDARAGREVG